MMYEIGMKVRITEDCRHEFYGNMSSKTGEFGIYVGEVPLDMNGELWDMPKIQFDDGDILYGCECWWEPATDESELLPLTEAQERLNAYKKIVLSIIEATPK